MQGETILLEKSGGEPYLIVYEKGTAEKIPLSGAQAFGRVSKSGRPDVASESSVVSRKHGLFRTIGRECRYMDLASTNGTLVNGAMMPPNTEYLLKEGDVLRVHGSNDPKCELDVLLIYTSIPRKNRSWNVISLDDQAAEIAVGRNENTSQFGETVSRRHASFFHAKKGWAVIDHGSKNGVFVNNRRLGQPQYLLPSDVISIADYLFIYTGSALYYESDTAEAAADTDDDIPTYIPAGPAVSTPLKTAAETVKTAAKTETEKVPEAVKTVPPKAEETPETPVKAAEAVSPNASQKPAEAASSDVSRKPGVLSVWIEERNVWQRMKKKTLLKNIRLDIPDSCMVLILGGSGAGKTTFMNAVMGYEQAEGVIRYRGMDIYDEYEQMKYEIGYVPQQDLMRMNDVVYDTLMNAARMRLPVGLTQEQYKERVESTIQLLGLDRVRDSLVGKLSGGQRKRLSIAVEYIGNPSLFFLDEPDSGLDGTMARALMENLRTIADSGKIVMVISHSPDRAFELWDRVIVLAKHSKDDSGHLVYYGTPKNACAFFEVDGLEKIVRRINAVDEGGEGLADHYIERFEEMRRRR